MRPLNTDAPTGELDESSLNAIRSILTEETAPAATRRQAHDDVSAVEKAPAPPRKADALPDLAAPVGDEVHGRDNYAGGATPARKSGLRFFKTRVRSQKPQPKHQAAKVAASKNAKTPKASGASNLPALSAMLDRVKAYRPTKAHIGLAMIALFVLMRPWLVLGLLVLFAIIMTGIFLMVGYDGFWQGVMKASHWYARRRPSRAASVHARLDRFAMRWDAVLDRFPEGTVDSFYLPDFSELATADARHDAAVERRLAGMSGKGA
jgi:hypothetical protein